MAPLESAGLLRFNGDTAASYRRRGAKTLSRA